MFPGYEDFVTTNARAQMEPAGCSLFFLRDQFFKCLTDVETISAALEHCFCPTPVELVVVEAML